jgi:hypothetical protein
MKESEMKLRQSIIAFSLIMALTGLSTGMEADTEDDEINGECQSVLCPTNGPHLTGLALQGVALDGLALHSIEVTLPQQAER